jgi:hypothetical protein
MGRIVSTKRHNELFTPIHENVMLFGKWVFIDAIKIRRNSIELWTALAKSGVLTRRQKCIKNADRYIGNKMM